MRSTSAETDPRAWITPEDLNVAPPLLGLPLAQPWRRALAMGVDLALLGLLSQGSSVLLAALAWAAWRWNRLQRLAPQGRATLAGWLPVVALLALGLYTSLSGDDDGPRRRAKAASGAPTEQAASAAAATRADAEDDGKDDETAGESHRLAREALQVAASAVAGTADEKQALQLELQAQREATAELKARLRRLEAEAVLDPREKLRRWVDEVGLNLAWALAYFVLWPLVWPGQTPGKRLMGLKVVELTGKPATLMLNMRRYGGYAACMATGGLGFAQILWDANRQGLHDKAAHTAVIDLRNPARLKLDPLPPAMEPQP